MKTANKRELIKQASHLTGIKNSDALLSRALEVLIAKTASHKILQFEGKQKDFKAGSRRRSA